jgi:hypothetical protein
LNVTPKEADRDREEKEGCGFGAVVFSADSVHPGAEGRKTPFPAVDVDDALRELF